MIWVALGVGLDVVPMMLRKPDGDGFVLRYLLVSSFSVGDVNC